MISEASFSTMSLLQAYLQSPKTRRVLNRKPGEKGFSLIELVVVVAVLAILAAIAIPSFTSISGKARASAAANTLATVAKECATKIADAGVGSGAQYSVPSLDSYTGWRTGAAMNNLNTVTGTQNCPASGIIGALSSNEAEYPSFYYNVSTGAKSCTATAATAESRGCRDVTNNSGTW